MFAEALQPPSTVQALQAELMAFVRAFGFHRPDQTPCGQPIAVAEAYALAELAHHAPLTQTALAARLQLEKSTVSRLVSFLVERDWVQRVPSATDRRVRELTLTSTGSALASTLAATRAARFERLLAHIPPNEHALVLTALHRLVEAAHAE